MAFAFFRVGLKDLKDFKNLKSTIEGTCKKILNILKTNLYIRQLNS